MGETQGRWHERLEAHPWLGLAATLPVAALLVWFAWGQWSKAQAFGDAPRDALSVDAARHGRKAPTWVRLSDASFDCDRSLVHGGVRYGPVKAPELPAGLLVARLGDVVCPGDGALVGVVDTMPGILRGHLTRKGMVLPEQPLVLATGDGPANARTGVVVLLSLAACVLFLGLTGYIIRGVTAYYRRKERVPPPPEAVMTALRPPLRVAPGYIGRRVALDATASAILVLMAAFIGYVGARQVWAVHVGEPRRWQRASAVPTREPPTVTAAGTFTFLDDVLADVEVTWAEPSGWQASVAYPVAWVGEVRGPVEVREDDRGYLSSVGLELAPERTAHGAGLLLVALGMLTLVAFVLRSLVRKVAAVRALERNPCPVFVELIAEEELRSYGVPLGHTQYTFYAPWGTPETQSLSVPRRALFDETGTRVLIVVPESRGEAPPILVADDGHPFVLPELDRARGWDPPQERTTDTPGP